MSNAIKRGIKRTAKRTAKWYIRRYILPAVILAIVVFAGNACTNGFFPAAIDSAKDALDSGKAAITDAAGGITEGLSGSENAPAETSEAIPQSGDSVTVERVVDGDTFATEGGEKVRLIGVDTPESVSPTEEKNVPFGKTASDYTKEQLEGHVVNLIYDVQERDKYGRVLAYVYLEDGTFYNLELIQKGYARVMTVPPNVAHEEDFVAAQETAKDSGIGIWQDYAANFPEK